MMSSEASEESSVYTLATEARDQLSARKAQATALVRASAKGDLAQVQQILESCDRVLKYGAVAVHEAAKAGHTEVVAELVSQNAEVGRVNKSGCTALHFAALCKDRERSLEIVLLMIDAQASVNHASMRLDTPLHFATYCHPAPGVLEVVKCLLEARANVNSPNRNAESPLMNAALHANAEAVKLLVEHAADISKRNASDKTARDLAAERGSDDVVEILDAAEGPGVGLNVDGITQQMRAALSQMQCVDLMSNQMRREAAMLEAFEAAAMAAMAEMDYEGRHMLAEHAAITLRGPAHAQPSRTEVLQALINLLLIARTHNGAALCWKVGLHEIMPVAEQHVAALDVGHRVIRDLSLAMLASPADHPDSSEPSTPRSDDSPVRNTGPSSCANSRASGRISLAVPQTVLPSYVPEGDPTSTIGSSSTDDSVREPAPSPPPADAHAGAGDSCASRKAKPAGRRSRGACSVT